MISTLQVWFYWALLSAGFAALTAIFAKIGLEGVSGLATGASWLCYFRPLQLGEGFESGVGR